MFTDSPFEMIRAEAQHLDHAIIEQVFADGSDGPLAHLPSGHLPANAAWLTCAAICHNLTRATRMLAGPLHAKARGATIRSQLISVAARIARHGRGHLTLHFPERWHREHQWMTLFEASAARLRRRLRALVLIWVRIPLQALALMPGLVASPAVPAPLPL